MTEWIKGTAKLVYAPARPGLKKVRAANDYFLVAEVSGDIAKYYSYWIKKTLYVSLQPPAWRQHITVLNGRHEVPADRRHLWKKHHNETIHFEYSVDVQQHWKFWVLPVRSNRLETIREEFGLASNHKQFHLTVGRMY